MSQPIKRIMDRIDKSLSKAFAVAIKEIEKEAKAAIKASPDTIKSFCMAMGTAHFKVVWTEDWDGEPMPRDENLGPGEFAEYGHKSPHADNIAKLLDEYNSMLRLTGWPLMIKRDDVTGELITLNDW